MTRILPWLVSTGVWVAGCVQPANFIIDAYNADDGGESVADDCPEDPSKLNLGQCGCGIPDADDDGDGVADCVDDCPNDPGKRVPGNCGCGTPDTDTDGDGTLDCLEQCPYDPNKLAPGRCGCGTSDGDDDSDDACEGAREELVPDEIEDIWRRGDTLPASVFGQHQLPPIDFPAGVADTGINVLIDLAHHLNFYTMWDLGGFLRRRGIRPVGSQAMLDCILPEGSYARVRLPLADAKPFAWWPVAPINVVMTRGGVSLQQFTDREISTLLAFVEQGGGLIVRGEVIGSTHLEQNCSLNRLLAHMGAKVLSQRVEFNGKSIAPLQLDENWEVVLASTTGEPVYARRELGAGRIALFSDASLVDPVRDSPTVDDQTDFLAKVVRWAAEGSPPAGGEPRLPTPMWGGGGIYPELERRADGVVVYFAQNQLPELLELIREDFVSATAQLYEWYPSPRPIEPMFIILSSGDGGGWAVNAYLPKEVGVISATPQNVMSVFAHEQAHTMSGPEPAAGSHPFGGNQGEPHAGWFQGKITSIYTGDLGPNRDCESVLLPGADPLSGDPDAIFKASHLDEWRDDQWNYGMVWFVWQKLDDRYGPTWYPRWRWVQGQRWAGEPTRQLSWEESIEDISIAVGEDLFPFFAKTGKVLAKDRFARADFMGQSLALPVAPIEPTPPLGVRHDAIGDYTLPIGIDPLPQLTLDPEDRVLTIANQDPDCDIRYTLDGTFPDATSPTYDAPLANVPNAGVALARCLLPDGHLGTVVQLGLASVRFEQIRYSYYEGQWDVLPDFDALRPADAGVTDSVDLSVAPRGTDFGLVFAGWLDPTEPGYYRFSLGSDDGSRLYVNDELVVDADGLHAFHKRAGVAYVSANTTFRVEYFQRGGLRQLSLQASSPLAGPLEP
jgi:hypothetical protein